MEKCKTLPKLHALSLLQPESQKKCIRFHQHRSYYSAAAYTLLILEQLSSRQRDENGDHSFFTSALHITWVLLEEEDK